MMLVLGTISKRLVGYWEPGYTRGTLSILGAGYTRGGRGVLEGGPGCTGTRKEQNGTSIH